MHPRYIVLFVLGLLTVVGLIVVMLGLNNEFWIGYHRRYVIENQAKADQLRRTGDLAGAQLAEEDAARDARYGAEAERNFWLGITAGGSLAALSVLGIVGLLLMPSFGRTTGVGRFDEHLRQQIAPLLRRDETVVNTAWLFEGPIKRPICYCAALTNERLLLAQTGLTFFLARPKPGTILAWELSDIGGCTTGGVAFQREITFILRDGRTLNLRMNTLANVISGSEKFLQEVPQRLTRRGVELGSK